MPNGGVRTLGSGQGHVHRNQLLDPEQIARLVDAREALIGSAGDTGWASGGKFLLEYADGLGSEWAAIVHTQACSACKIEEIGIDSPPGWNLIEACKRNHVITTQCGLSYHLAFIDFVHGEANWSDRRGVYSAKVDALQQWFDGHLRHLNDPTYAETPIPLVIDQLPSFTRLAGGKRTSSTIPLDQLDLALQYPDRFVMVGPKFHLPFIDGVHHTPHGYRWAAETRSWAKARRLKYGMAGWPVFYPADYTRIGDCISVPVRGLLGTLEIKDGIYDPGHRGVVWQQTGGTLRSIVSVDIVGADMIHVRLDGDPGDVESESLRFGLDGIAGENAGPTTGPRHCFGDSVTALSSDGETVLHRMMCVNECFRIHK